MAVHRHWSDDAPNTMESSMKKLILAGAVLAVIASPAFAQNYIPSFGSGNIAPMVTPANPDGIFRYPSTDHSVAPSRRARIARVTVRRHVATVHAHTPTLRHESRANDSYAQDEAGSARARGYSGRLRSYSGETDPDPNIQFQLNREAQEGCYTEGC